MLTNNTGRNKTAIILIEFAYYVDYYSYKFQHCEGGTTEAILP